MRSDWMPGGAEEDALRERKFRVENAAWGVGFAYAAGFQDASLKAGRPQDIRAEWVCEFADHWAQRALARYHGGAEPLLHVNGVAQHFTTWLAGKQATTN